MNATTHQETILATLRTATRPLNDDELARRTGISPRQTVNQVCRALAAKGLLRRVIGRDGKLVNELVQTVPQPSPVDVAGVTTDETEGAVEEIPPAEPRIEPIAGSSYEQRRAEGEMLAGLSTALGVSLAPRRLVHPSGARVELDGADPELTVLVECWAHQGTAKVAQKYKLVNDAAKLHWIAQSLSPRPERLVICVSDPAAIQHLQGRSWQGQAIAEMGVELVVIDLPAEVVASIVAAQERQYR